MRSTSPRHPYRYRRRSWRCSPLWGGCSATETTTSKYSPAWSEPGGAEPPSTASVVARGVILVGSLLVTSMFLLGRVRRRNKG